MMDNIRLMAGAGTPSSSSVAPSTDRAQSEALQWHTAYSAVAEVVHVFRRLLTSSQLFRAVELFCSLPMSLGVKHGAQYGSSGAQEKLLAAFSSDGVDLGPVPPTSHVTIVRVLFHLNGESTLHYHPTAYL